MGIGFTLEVRATALSIALPMAAHATAALGVGIAAQRLIVLGQAATAAAVACVGALMIAWSARRWGRPVQGRLVVDDDGRARWTALGRGAPQAVVPLRWLPAGGVAWLRLQPLAGSALNERGAFDLLLLKASCGRDTWRALLAWLAWHERGGPRQPTL